MWMFYETKDNTSRSKVSYRQMVTDLIQYKNNKGENMITRDAIIEAVISVVEENIISQTPRLVGEDQLKQILDSGREGLVATANAIADKLLNKTV
jgi:hypothetical protein